MKTLFVWLFCHKSDIVRSRLIASWWSHLKLAQQQTRQRTRRPHPNYHSSGSKWCEKRKICAVSLFRETLCISPLKRFWRAELSRDWRVTEKVAHARSRKVLVIGPLGYAQFLPTTHCDQTYLSLVNKKFLKLDNLKKTKRWLFHCCSKLELCLLELLILPIPTQLLLVEGNIKW